MSDEQLLTIDVGTFSCKNFWEPACGRWFTAKPGVSWHLLSRHGFTGIITRFGGTVSSVLLDMLLLVQLNTFNCFQVDANSNFNFDFQDLLM